MTRIAINGACGRMSQRIAHLAAADDDLAIAAALELESHPRQGHDYGEVLGLGSIGVPLQMSLTAALEIDTVIDFSLPAGTMSVLPQCVALQIPLVIATTGHTKPQISEIRAAAKNIAILMAPNMSLVVNLLFKLTQIAGSALRGKDFDVEIIERHHRFKQDSPSGTALKFADIVQESMNLNKRRHGREGLVGERPRDEIGMHAVRVGDNVGEHAIVFSTLGETMELVQRAHSRDSYARGALLAAKYLKGMPAGQYSMDDVLGL